MVPGSMFNDKQGDKNCYLPIFRNSDPENTAWVFGAIFMEKYYFVYDMSSEDLGYN